MSACATCTLSESAGMHVLHMQVQVRSSFYKMWIFLCENVDIHTKKTAHEGVIHISCLYGGFESNEITQLCRFYPAFFTVPSGLIFFPFGSVLYLLAFGPLYTMIGVCASMVS